MNLPSLGGNWVDLLILAILLFFAFDGVRAGFFVMGVDFLGFLASLLISLRVYQLVSNLLQANFSLSHSLANALGFLATAVLIETLLGLVFKKLIGFLPKRLWKSKINHLFGILPALGEGLVIIAFGLTLAIALPIKPQVKVDITKSKIGSQIVRKTTRIEAHLNEVFGGVLENSLTYFTIRPGSRESVPLEVGNEGLTIDQEAEGVMFEMINEERRSRGVEELAWRPELVPVARAHASDMWERKYFSHYSPEGEDVGDRLQEANVFFTFAGENLALAPTIQTAHTGLMNSEGHRANILDPRFRQVALGVIDNSIYGKMFVQIFTD
jgi:uncharacterized protein YkwD